MEFVRAAGIQRHQLGRETRIEIEVHMGVHL